MKIQKLLDASKKIQTWIHAHPRKATIVQSVIDEFDNAIAEFKESKGEPVKEMLTKYKDFVLREQKEGNVIVMTFDGMARIKLSDILDQPTEGLLYDLNRDFGTIMCFIDDPKWINDFACYQVITELKRRLDELNSKK